MGHPSASGEQPQPRRLHILTILFAAARIARTLVVPAIAGGISASRRNVENATDLIVVLTVVPALIVSAARYLMFRYRLSDEALIIDSGVLQRQHRVIPVASVQNVQLRETALQRFVGLAAVTVETATAGHRADAELAVLSRRDAEALRKEIFARRARAGVASTASDEVRPVEETVLVRLGTRDLIIAGATANHAGLIAAALIAGLQVLDDLPLENFIGTTATALLPRSVGTAVLALLVASLLLIVTGWIVSIVASVVGNHGFTLVRRDDQLDKRHGLLGRRETMIPLRRVQGLRVEESILRRPLALANMRIATAGTAGRPTEPWGTQTITPIRRAAAVAPLVQAIFPDVAYEQVALQPVHPRSRVRAFTRYAVALMGMAAAAAVWNTPVALVAVPLLVPAWLIAAWQYRCRGYAVRKNYVFARNGVLNRVTWIVPERKLQTVHVRESPFQRRYGLASVLLDTAGGGGHAAIHDLAHDDAVRLANSLRGTAR